MVLLVEDEAINRTAIAEALRNAGQQVLEAAKGEEALAVVADNPSINLLVMDLVLPGMDGLKLMDLIHQRRPKLPTILVSGYLSQRAGNLIVTTSTTTKYFAKPVRPAALVRTAQELLSVN